MRFFLIASLLGAVMGVGMGCRQSAPEPEVSTAMVLKSSAFEEGKPIPEKYSAYGANVSPPLEWSGAPSGTQSFVLILDDPDAPRSTPFVHWVLYDIPASETQIAEGKAPMGSMSGENDMGTQGYFGPRPPSGVHHYHFKLYALSKTLGLGPGASEDEVLKKMGTDILTKRELVGIFAR